MFGFVTGIFGIGGLIGLFCLRRGWYRAFLFWLLLALFVMGTAALGVFPLELFGNQIGIAAAVILSAPPLAAGLVCGGLIAWLLLRANG
ncbi:MAG: hypothetical protein AAF218_02980 [Pseudomonadota bacterium]